MAAAAGPVPIKLLTPSARLAYKNGQATEVLYTRCIPIFSTMPSTFPSSDKANGPGVPGGGVGNNDPIDFNTVVASLFSGLSQMPITSLPPGRSTRYASRRAASKSDAYWKELNPTTT